MTKIGHTFRNKQKKIIIIEVNAVGGLMGGKVLDLDIFQAERKAHCEGKAEGISEDANMLSSLLKKLTPGSDDHNLALNATDEEREELYRKYKIKIPQKE